MSFPASAPALAGIHRALAVFAHPDDVDFGCAGTIAGWVDEGTGAAYLIVTQGDAGGFVDGTLAPTTALRRDITAAPAGVRRGGGPPPSGTARTGWTSGACAARSTRASRPS
ncbi:PIG-L deacetylase family protein [Micromonospora sp. CA-111912]|uniref:PIG-L deacetylase family protein n=1 Tax=Micromonospora sp. CA-111912 TaxID=3239955 RepID=UPI003D8DA3BF